MRKLWIDITELWKEDRKEFWDLLGGLTIIILFYLFTFVFLIPVLGGG